MSFSLLFFFAFVMNKVISFLVHVSFVLLFVYAVMQVFDFAYQSFIAAQMH